MANDASDEPSRRTRPGGAPFVDRLPASVIARFLGEYSDERTDTPSDAGGLPVAGVETKSAQLVAPAGLRALALTADGRCIVLDNCDFRARPTVVIVDASGHVVTPAPVVRAIGDFPDAVALDDTASESHLRTLDVANPALMHEVVEILRQAQ